MLAVVLLAVAAGVAALAVIGVRHYDHSGGRGVGGGVGSTPIALTAVSSYDPDGDHHENAGTIGLATDGSTATAWTTESYNASGGIFTTQNGVTKPGVGIILDAGAAKKVHTVTIVSTTPGYTAEIQSSDSEFGPFSDDSSSQVGAARTTFELDGATARYYLIWITNRGSDNPAVSINQVTAN